MAAIRFLFVTLLFSTEAVDVALASSHHCSPSERPAATEAVEVARWLIGRASWGVVSTSSAARGGAAWGNVMSVTDNCTGVPMFYMSSMDETARDIAANPRATFTVAEAELPKQCVFKDPESPLCAKLSLHGEVILAPDQRAARAALFERHPEMRLWPSNHGFQAFVMHPILDVFVLSDFGGAKAISVAEYLSAKQMVSHVS